MFGLVMNVVGATILAISLTAGDGRQTSPTTGIDYHVALISDWGFKLGLYLFLFGFACQILEKKHDGEIINFKEMLLTFPVTLIAYTLVLRSSGILFI